MEAYNREVISKQKQNANTIARETYSFAIIYGGHRKMVDQNETYQWVATLADDTVVKEADGAKFDLGWENAGTLNKFELVQVGGDASYSVDLTDGDFNLNGDTDIPTGFGGKAARGLRFFKLNIVRVDRGEQLGNRVMYFIGYGKGNREKLYKIAPAIGQVENESGYATR